jgi:hypothetical protein
MRSFDRTDITTYDRGQMRVVQMNFMREDLEYEENGSYVTLMLIARYRLEGKRGERKPGRLIGAELSSGGDELTSTELSRFPWTRWLRLADLHAQAETGWMSGDPFDFGTTPDTELARVAARNTQSHVDREKRQLGNDASRPGRRGHGLEFYKGVASEYAHLVEGGEQAPATAMAKARQNSIHTVNGWIRRCRKLGLLPDSPRSRARKASQ